MPFCHSFASKEMKVSKGYLNTKGDRVVSLYYFRYRMDIYFYVKYSYSKVHFLKNHKIFPSIYNVLGISNLRKMNTTY